jgi:hypothetical protein
MGTKRKGQEQTICGTNFLERRGTKMKIIIGEQICGTNFLERRGTKMKIIREQKISLWNKS